MDMEMGDQPVIHYSVQRKNIEGKWFTTKVTSIEDEALEAAKKLGRNVRVRKTTDEVLKLPLPDEVTITFKVDKAKVPQSHSLYRAKSSYGNMYLNEKHLRELGEQ